MKILFPVDGSDRSLETIRQASQLLDKSGAEVCLLTVVTPVVTDLPVVALEPDAQFAQGILEAAKVVARGEGFNVVSSKFVTHFNPAKAICAYADEVGVEQIVIGSHGHQGLVRLLMGSVSEEVLKMANQPVILIRNDKNRTVEISHYDQAKLQKAQ